MKPQEIQMAHLFVHHTTIAFKRYTQYECTHILKEIFKFFRGYIYILYFLELQKHFISRPERNFLHSPLPLLQLNSMMNLRFFMSPSQCKTFEIFYSKLFSLKAIFHFLSFLIINFGRKCLGSCIHDFQILGDKRASVEIQKKARFLDNYY